MCWSSAAAVVAVSVKAAAAAPVAF